MEESKLTMFNEEHSILYNEETINECMQSLKDSTKQPVYPLIPLDEEDFTWKILNSKTDGRE